MDFQRQLCEEQAHNLKKKQTDQENAHRLQFEMLEDSHRLQSKRKEDVSRSQSEKQEDVITKLNAKVK